VYGATDPSLTYTVSGYVNSDNGSILSGSLSRAAGEAVNTYAINQGTLSAGNNYSITYTGNNFTITKATLTITADAGQSKVYGATEPSLTYTVSGYVNSDNSSILSGSLSRATGEAVNTYAINQGTLSAGNNYTIAYTGTNFIITKATLTITANSAQTKVYGNSDPVLTYTVSGYVNGDNSSVLNGSLSRAAGENVGIYAINLGTLSAGNNYTISYTGNNFTITKAAQTITWIQDLTTGCSGAATPIQLAATASSGLGVTYTVTNTAIAIVSGSTLTPVQEGATDITATQPGDNNHFAATAVANTFNYQLSNAVRQHWSDALLFDNTSENYTQWQWYKNGTAVSGAFNPYYGETVALNGTYYVMATNRNGNVVQSCPLVLTGSSTVTGGMKVFPNPATAGTPVTVTCDYTDAALTGARLVITNITGITIQQLTSVHPSNTVSVPATSGVYTITLLLSNGQKKTVNVLIR